MTAAWAVSSDLPCPPESHWCQNPDDPNGYSMHASDHKDPLKQTRPRIHRERDAD